MTVTYSLFTPTMTGHFYQFFLYVARKPNPFEMAQWSSVPIAFVTAQQACRLVCRHWPPGPALFSPALKAFADDGRCTASLMHWVQGQTGSSAHNHYGRPHPIPIAFPLTGGKRSHGAYHCGWDKFSRNGWEDGEGSPLTLIWANGTPPASYNNIPTEKGFLDDRAALPVSDRKQWIN